MVAPLSGLRVLELAGLAPSPFAGLILADFGADVVRVDRMQRFTTDELSRGKRSVCVNLKTKEGVATLLRLCEKADVLIEPFRPGVLESLGLGPSILHARNPRLVVARMTGFGQAGTYSQMAGHDINYLATSGVLSLLGRAGEPPLAPGNLLGDFAAGSLFCVVGILMALQQRQRTGKGDVVDAAIVDGATYLASFVLRALESGIWAPERGTNMLDGGAPFYDCYETKDGEYMSVGALESQFFARLLGGLGLTADDVGDQIDQSAWPEMREKFAAIFRSKTQAEWSGVFDGTDACVTAVVELPEAGRAPHGADRRLVVEAAAADGGDASLEAAPAPRFLGLGQDTRKGTGPSTPFRFDVRSRPSVGEHTVGVLKENGFTATEIAQLARANAVNGPGEGKSRL